MPSFVIDTLSTTAQTLVSTAETGVITARGSLVVSGNPAVSASGGRLSVFGTLAAAGAPGVQNTDASLVLFVGSQGSIVGSGDAIRSVGAPSLRVHNAGDIFGDVDGIDATSATGVTMNISNEGRIVGLLGEALDLFAPDASVQILNSGELRGATIGVFAAAARVLVVNSGTIDTAENGFGDLVAVDLSASGTARLVNAGTVIGDLRFGAGADRYDGSGGMLQGIVTAGGGNDSLRGGERRDMFLGEDGNDLLSGAGGDDDLSGGSGNDLVTGGAGGDSLLGGQGNDTLQGDAGDDTLEGGAGADRLTGGSGADRLTGGAGRDTLTGGEGEDAFVFLAVADSPTGAANRDTIADFRRGADVIDLSAVNPGEFAFRGTQALLSDGTPSVNHSVTPAGHAVVRVDNNGDGTADMEIVLLNSGALAAADFLL